jgi:hypothetical protein
VSAPCLEHAADCSRVQAYVLRAVGGRAYRAHVPVELRVQVMHDRAPESRQECSRAAVAAQAVANYLAGIGDRESGLRWSEMAADLHLVAGRRAR